MMSRESAPSDNAAARSRGSGLGIISFLFLWLVIGFTMGTLVLVGPVRWLVAGVKRAGGETSVENYAVIGLVIVYVIVSFLLALKLNGYLFRSHSRPVRLGVPAALTVAALVTAWQWRDPSVLLSGMAGGGDLGEVQTVSGAIFEFGSYPDEDRLRQLKTQGVTAVISLQHPSDLVERRGIANEGRATKAIGLTLINAPMLPWFSDNRAALDTLRALATRGRGKYYVHCGLGRDRVNIAKKVIEGLGVKTVMAKDFGAGLGFEERDHPFIHGTLLHLSKGVWLVPYLEHEEAYGCLLEGRPGNIVFILDPADPKQKIRLSEMSSLLDQYGVRYSLLAVGVPDGSGAVAAADSAHRLPLPVTIIASETPWVDGLPRAGAENALAFRAAYLKGRPARSQNGPGVATSYVAPVSPTTTEDLRKGC